MRIGQMIIGFAAGACTVLGAATMLPQDAGDAQSPEQAWMEFMGKYGVPSKEHEMLSDLVGVWDVSLKSWTMPGAEPQVSTGKSFFESIMDGRFVTQQYESEFEGMTFEGGGIMGYDRFKGQYFSIWVDNMSTGPMISHGHKGEGHSIDFWGSMPDPMSGNMMPVRTIERFESKDKFVADMFGPAPDGSMFKMMEIEYTRSK